MSAFYKLLICCLFFLPTNHIKSQTPYIKVNSFNNELEFTMRKKESNNATLKYKGSDIIELSYEGFSNDFYLKKKF